MGILRAPDDENEEGSEKSIETPDDPQPFQPATIEGRVSVILKRFDLEDKVGLAKELIEALEVEPSEKLLSKVQHALGRDITSKEQFQLEVLEQIAKDRDYFRSRRPFDDLGAPKAGL